MTHKELIEVLGHTAQDGMADEPVLKAVRAVVELHRPYDPEFESLEGQLLACHNCNVLYPCPTIQVIQKELQ